MAADRLDHVIDHARAEREYLRWVILLALWHARPYGTTEGVIIGACRDIPLRVTADEIRRELDSLEKRGLVVVYRNLPLWSAELTAAGEDVVDYRAEAPAGIARPPRW
ncbi:MAG: cytoplasmic protein [Rhodocyclaceae bacterium]|nr:cytoplasmic protein [Rhodocyclaceae bacterium]